MEPGTVYAFFAVLWALSAIVVVLWNVYLPEQKALPAGPASPLQKAKSPTERSQILERLRRSQPTDRLLDAIGEYGEHIISPRR